MREEKSDSRYRLNVDQIQKFLPHRHPFLMVDRILEIHPTGDVSNPEFDSTKIGIKVIAQKAVAFNEPWFQGHFPGFAILPGVLILEAMAQAASFSIYPYFGDDVSQFSRNFESIFVGVDRARFRKPVFPGDTLKITTESTKVRGKLWAFYCEALLIDGQLAAEAEILVSLVAGKGERI